LLSLKSIDLCCEEVVVERSYLDIVDEYLGGDDDTTTAHTGKFSG
jgi:hypothetical protein